MAYTTRFGKRVPLHGFRSSGSKTPAIDAELQRRREETQLIDKGVYDGACNQSACLRPGAKWFNHSTRKYYCEDCAIWLNTDEFNRRDAMEIWGHDLCTFVEKESNHDH